MMMKLWKTALPLFVVCPVLVALAGTDSFQSKHEAMERLRASVAGPESLLFTSSGTVRVHDLLSDREVEGDITYDLVTSGEKLCLNATISDEFVGVGGTFIDGRRLVFDGTRTFSLNPRMKQLVFFSGNATRPGSGDGLGQYAPITNPLLWMFSFLEFQERECAICQLTYDEFDREPWDRALSGLDIELEEDALIFKPRRPEASEADEVAEVQFKLTFEEGDLGLLPTSMEASLEDASTMSIVVDEYQLVACSEVTDGCVFPKSITATSRGPEYEKTIRLEIELLSVGGTISDGTWSVTLSGDLDGYTIIDGDTRQVVEALP